VNEVRCKLFRPGVDNFGTKWIKVLVNDYGAGKFTFTAYKPVNWTKFRVATHNNERVLQECYLNPLDRSRMEGHDDAPEGVALDAGDTITIEFVVHELAFRCRVNDDMDDEDQAILNLTRLKKRLG
jgi:hypothetical protein